VRCTHKAKRKVMLCRFSGAAREESDKQSGRKKEKIPLERNFHNNTARALLLHKAK
jgi:hypothetical protein